MRASEQSAKLQPANSNCKPQHANRKPQTTDHKLFDTNLSPHVRAHVVRAPPRARDVFLSFPLPPPPLFPTEHMQDGPRAIHKRALLTRVHSGTAANGCFQSDWYKRLSIRGDGMKPQHPPLRCLCLPCPALLERTPFRIVRHAARGGCAVSLLRTTPQPGRHRASSR